MSFLDQNPTGPGSWVAATAASVVAHAVVGTALLASYAQFLEAAEIPERRTGDVIITLDRLESDTLAGIVEQLGEAGSDGDSDVVEAEEDGAPEVASEDSALLEGEDAETLDGVDALADELESDVAETLDAAEEDALAAGAPGEEPTALDAEETEELIATEDTEQAAEPETTADDVASEDVPELADVPETPEAEEPATETVVEAELETPVSPLEPEEEETSPLSPLASGEGSSELATAAPAAAPPPAAETTSEPVAESEPAAESGDALDAFVADELDGEEIEGEAIELAALPAEQEEELNAEPDPSETAETPAEPTAAARPRRPRQPLSEQDLALGTLIDRLRRAGGEECLLALPRRDGADGVGIAMIAASDTAMQSFGEEVLTRPGDADMRQTRTLVDPRQCPALSFVRRNLEYPATRLGIRLDNPEVPSGGTLIGTLRGIQGRSLTLLLIDNNGVVQDLGRFLTENGNYARFEVPMTRVGSRRDTKQVLLAVATEEADPTLTDRNGALAQDVFANLGGELGGRAALAITTFDVR